MMDQLQLKKLVENITRNKQFNDYIVSIFNENKEPIDLPFEKYARGSSANNVQFNSVLKETTQNICELIDSNIKRILGKQFTNVGAYIMEMRKQLNDYAAEQHKKTEEFKLSFKNQIETLKKKIVLHNFVQPQFHANKIQVPKRFNMQENVSFHQELKQIKDTIKKIKQIPHLQKLTQKVIFLEEKVAMQITEMKIAIETTKQKQSAYSNEISNQMISSREDKDTKRKIQGFKKVFIQEIQKQKAKTQKIQQSLQVLNRNLQQYMGKQIGSVWTQVSNIKRRVQSIQQSINLQNQSFIYQ